MGLCDTGSDECLGFLLNSSSHFPGLCRLVLTCSHDSLFLRYPAIDIVWRGPALLALGFLRYLALRGSAWWSPGPGWCSLQSSRTSVLPFLTLTHALTVYNTPPMVSALASNPTGPRVPFAAPEPRPVSVFAWASAGGSSGLECSAVRLAAIPYRVSPGFSSVNAGMYVRAVALHCRSPPLSAVLPSEGGRCAVADAPLPRCPRFCPSWRRLRPPSRCYYARSIFWLIVLCVSQPKMSRGVVRHRK